MLWENAENTMWIFSMFSYSDNDFYFVNGKNVLIYILFDTILLIQLWTKLILSSGKKSFVNSAHVILLQSRSGKVTILRGFYSSIISRLFAFDILLKITSRAISIRKFSDTSTVYQTTNYYNCQERKNLCSEGNFYWSDHLSEVMLGVGGRGPGACSLKKILKIRRSLVHSNALFFRFFYALFPLAEKVRKTALKPQ